MIRRPKWRRTLRSALLKAGSAEEVLRDVIRQLDLPEPDGDDDLTKLALARAVIATAYALLEAQPGHTQITATVDAAVAYVTSPSTSTHARYFAAATYSYPFGPGDGCYSTLANHCDHVARGSGCRSGAGTLMNIGHAIGMARTIELIRAALVPWLDQLDATS